VFASLGDEAAREHLGGKQRGTCDVDLGLLAEQFAPIEGLHGELNQGFVGVLHGSRGCLLDPCPLLREDANAHVPGFVGGVGHGVLSRVSLYPVTHEAELRRTLHK